MRATFQALAHIATDEFANLVVGTTLVGGTPNDPNKLRLLLRDSSFLDIWLSADGDYSFHWEQRRQHGKLYRWDNAPHHPQIATFPHHLHEGDESTIVPSYLNSTIEIALRQVLEYVQSRIL
jgi:hypothetical protein